MRISHKVSPYLLLVAEVLLLCSCTSVDPNYSAGVELYKGGEGNYTKAFSSFSAAANNGDSGGKFMLGYMHLLGHGTTQNFEEGLKLIKDACKDGNIEAQFLWGVFNLLGALPKEQYDKIPLASGNDFKDIKALISILKIHHSELPNDIKEGLSLIEKSADEDFLDAQMALYGLYSENGSEDSLKKAFYWIKRAAKQDPGEATALLGIHYLDGIGTEKDYERAFSAFETAEKANCPEAILQIGKMYSQGIFLNKNLELAKKYFSRASDLGCGEATRLLALQYSDKDNKDTKVMLQLLEKGYHQGDSLSALLLGLIFSDGFEGISPNIDKAISWLEKAGNLECHEADVALGKIYYFDDRVTKNYPKAYQLFKRAADANVPEGHYYLYVMLENGDGCQQNISLAIKHLKKAADAGDSQAQCDLALKFQEGDGVKKDPEKALKLFTLSADQGNSYALYYLGLIYLSGSSTAKDERKGLDLLSKASAKGLPIAQCTLGDILQKEKPEDAFELYSSAAKKGFPIAFDRLGACYLLGTGTTKDMEKARDYYKKGAEASVENSIYIYALMCYDGSGGEKDLAEAFRLFSSLDQKGIAAGSYYLGDMYLKGLYVSESRETAIAYFRKSAEKNYSDAQFALGMMYYYGGPGTEQDFATAATWFERAADAGNEKAQKFLNYRNGRKQNTSRISFEQRLGLKYEYETQSNGED